MTVSPGESSGRAAPRDHGFHSLRVKGLVRERGDAVSVVLEVPPEMREAFNYQSGQFVTFRLEIDGEQQLRSYSMSSSPAVDSDLRVTIKRVPDGAVSTWFNTVLETGQLVDVTLPAGVFCLPSDGSDVVAFAGGSGITPVYSLLKSALVGPTQRVRMLYANRDRDSVIFLDELDVLAQQNPDRLDLVHHLDDQAGYVDRAAVEALIGRDSSEHYYICGPAPFMDLVEGILLEKAVDSTRIHIERFTPSEGADAEAAAEPVAGEVVTATVTIELNGKTETAEHRPGATILQTARQLAMHPPYSCEAGDCATCMAKIIEGAATMRNNNALTDDEVEEGWVLTCQAVPTTPTVHVIYEN
jgi:3-ketosteroid 9alpha-monooxygenase subunit B